MSMAALRWARAVRGITGTQKLVLWALADMANDYAEAWPTAMAVAADCCITDRAVRDAMDALEAAGLIGGERAQGRATRWVLNLDQAVAIEPKPSPAGGSGPPERRSSNLEQASGHQRRGSPPAYASETSEAGSDLFPEQPGTTFLTPQEPHSYPPRNHVPATPEPRSDITLKNPHRTPIGTLTARTRDADADPFEVWWSFYPRKVGKDAARRAYAAALKRGASHADLATGLQRQQWPAEPRFVPHPSTWLNGGRWQDDPAAAAPQPAKDDSTWWAEPPDPPPRENDARQAFDIESTADPWP